MKKKNDLVVIAPFYETTDNIRENIFKGNESIDIKKCEKDIYC